MSRGGASSSDDYAGAGWATPDAYRCQPGTAPAEEEPREGARSPRLGAANAHRAAPLCLLLHASSAGQNRRSAAEDAGTLGKSAAPGPARGQVQREERRERRAGRSEPSVRGKAERHGAAGGAAGQHTGSAEAPPSLRQSPDARRRGGTGPSARGSVPGPEVPLAAGSVRAEVFRSQISRECPGFSHVKCRREPEPDGSPGRRDPGQGSPSRPCSSPPCRSPARTGAAVPAPGAGRLRGAAESGAGTVCKVRSDRRPRRSGRGSTGLGPVTRSALAPRGEVPV